jgi:hypothetical protein
LVGDDSEVAVAVLSFTTWVKMDEVESAKVRPNRWRLQMAWLLVAK